MEGLLIRYLWEGIGVVSYLLINFYFTRIQSNKAAILALTMNRVGAMRGRISLMCLKLSNSGDTLKLLVPSLMRKYTSGQSNYLGMVTSQKMIENEMGNRGSKSVLGPVKEQRVDGSWFLTLTVRSLRCTLMGFERNYQIKVLSKQLNKRNFCNSAYGQVQFTEVRLDPWFVTGFCDGEASFSVAIYIDKRIKKRVAWVVKVSFQISLHTRDMALLLKLQEFFACGIIVSKNNRDEISFRVNSIHDLMNFVIPHFINYNLLSQKAADFELFKQIVILINTKVHLTDLGLQQIINIRSSMNLGLSDLQKYEFINYKPVPRPVINYTEIPNPNWIAGFSSAEGCFLVNILKSNKINNKNQFVQLIFKISQHNRDTKLLELIAKYLNCGQVMVHSKNAKVFAVGKFIDINNKIIPIFKAHSIQGVKQLDYQDFCEIAILISEGKHLSPIGIAKIQLIKDRMNTKRK